MSDTPDLLAAFNAAGLIDVAYATADSPLGPLLLVASPRGLLRLAYPTFDPDAELSEIAARISPRVIAAPQRLDVPRRQLEQYFEGRRQDFALPLDRRLMRPGFSTRVLTATAKIPFGATASYQRVAEAAGSPRAFRAAGTALGHNPLPVVIPCHRVLPASGALGSYTGGSERKAVLLQLEGANPAKTGT